MTAITDRIHTQQRKEPTDARARLMRAAGDLIGSERLAAELNISKRNCYQLMSGDRPVRDGHLADTRKILIRYRQAIGDAVAAIRAEEERAGEGGAQ